MDKNATLVSTKQSNSTDGNNTPKKSTIEFLMQFARAYSFQKELSVNLGGFVIN